ncbi:hypothetical protein ACPA54_00555 [Uniformispora flossi]|uniref:hypothetical protein n=1 Tax=Uniformispora flossi TaxID=3390723 RepID=UPI003C2C83B8
MAVKQGKRTGKAGRMAGVGLTAALLAAGLALPAAAHAQGAGPVAPAAVTPDASVWRIDTPGVGDASVAVPADVSTVGGTSVTVGYIRPAGTKGWAPLAAHYANGRWVPDTVPVPGGSAVARLHQVQVTGAGQAWAAGYVSADGTDRPWVTRWDGRAWTTVDTSALPSGILYGLSGTANDLWAVGAADDGALVAHWDGRAWTRVKLPVAPDGSAWDVGWYSAVAAAAADDVWVVGPENTSAHWDGRAWTRVAVPLGGDGASVWLENVRASRTQGTWAVGYVVGQEREAIALRWTGRAWERVPLPAGSAARQLDDVAFTAAGPVAVGARNEPSAPIGEAGYAVRLPARPGQPASPVTLPSGTEHLWGASTGEFGIGLRVVGTAQNPELSSTLPFTAWSPWIPAS